MTIDPLLKEARTQARVPPHSLEAEQSILGSFLLDPEAITKVLDFLKADDFYRENHRHIYRAAQALFREGEPMDSITVSAELERMGVLEQVGGRAYLALLEQVVPTAANVEYYGRIVKERSYKRSLISVAARISSLGYDEGREAEEALNEANSLVYAIAEDRVGSEFNRLDKLLRAAMDRIDSQMNSGSGVVGVPSGFYELDGLTSGFKPSDLVIVAGRPSMGKTSFALNVALRAAVEDKVAVAIFSLEMSKEQLVERMLCEHARIDAQRMHRGHLGDAEYERLVAALGPLEEAPIFIDDSPTMDDLTVMLKARQMKVREDIGLIVVDYLQLMHGRSRSDDNRVQEVSAISRGLKALARELKVPVIAISQLSRAPEQRPDRRPMLSDLRESGCLAADTLVDLPQEGARRPIGDLVGSRDLVALAYDRGTGRLKNHPVASAFATGLRPVLRLTTGSGRTLRATGNHRFLTPLGWRRLDSLAPGVPLAAPQVEPWRAGRPAGEGWAWDSVSTIRPDGEDEVFDLTVEPVHNFVAGGLVVHNSIEQDADMVLFVFRPEYYKPEDRPGIAELILAKHRNGPTGTVELIFRRDLTRFENRTRRSGPEEEPAEG